MDYLLSTVTRELNDHVNLIHDRLVKYGELVVGSAEDTAFLASVPKIVADAMIDARKAVVDGIKAIDTAGGTVKLREALAGLELRERFNVNEALPGLPHTVVEMFNFLGVPDAERNPAMSVKLPLQWEAQRRLWKAPPAGTVLSNSAVFDYWSGQATTAPELSALATLHWLRPVSSATVERIYSLLTHMDIPSRRSMGQVMLKHQLFLAGNALLVTDLLHDFADSIRRPAAAEVESSLGKRKRQEQKRAEAGAAIAIERAHASAAASLATGSAAEPVLPDSESVPEGLGEAEL
jgi:hypothetical protein